MPNDLFKATGRLEGRSGQDQNSYLGSFGAAYKVGSGFTVLARDIFSIVNTKTTGLVDQTTLGTYRNQHRFQIGGAYRPVRNDRWNALAKYEFRTGEDPDTTFSGALRRRVHIVSTDFNYQPSAATTLRLHYAWRKSFLDGDSLNSGSSAHLLSGRIQRELGRRFELDLHGGRLFDRSGGQWGAGVELAYLMGRDMQLGLGYNILGFRDDELTIDEYSRRGAYLRLRYKFDEDLLLRGMRSEDRLANSPKGHGIDANALNNTPLIGSEGSPLNGRPYNDGARVPVATSDLPLGLPTGNSPAALDALPGSDDIVQDEATAETEVQTQDVK